MVLVAAAAKARIVSIMTDTFSVIHPQTPEHCPERQRAMRDRILFNGKSDLEKWLPLVALQGGKSLHEPSRTGKEIDYGNWHALPIGYASLGAGLAANRFNRSAESP